jgi:PhnB protein
MEKTILQPIPYLFFDGTCTEALAFYAEVFGGTVVSSLTYGEMPGDMPCPDEAKDRVMNAMLELPGGNMIYASDSFPCRATGPVSGFMIALNYPTVEEGQEVFDRLADGGQIVMPFDPSFWADKFGMLTDKFGIEWAINGNLPPRT